jgi:hypothetical protein
MTTMPRLVIFFSVDDTIATDIYFFLDASLTSVPDVLTAILIWNYATLPRAETVSYNQSQI